MADITVVGTEGAFPADAAQPNMVEVGTWGWFAVFEDIVAAVKQNVAIFLHAIRR